MRWDEYQPIRLLPEAITNLFSAEAGFLYQDLSANKLRIILIPAPDPRHVGHKVRAVEVPNPEWYSKLYHAYPPHFRRDRSLRALERLILKNDQFFMDQNCGAVEYKYNYDTIYRKFIFDRLTMGHINYGMEESPNSEACSYFGFPCKYGDEVPF